MNDANDPHRSYEEVDFQLAAIRAWLLSLPPDTAIRLRAYTLTGSEATYQTLIAPPDITTAAQQRLAERMREEEAASAARANRAVTVERVSRAIDYLRTGGYVPREATPETKA